jgi:hypothetical protein
MLDTGAAMAASAKNSYLVYKIALFQNVQFTMLQIYLIETEA